jgi:hypothetical protein
MQTTPSRFMPAALLSTALTLLLAGCVAAIPVAVKYYKEKDFAKFDIMIQGDAKQIYADAVASVKANNPSLEIEKDDAEDLEFKGSVKKESGRTLVAMWEAKQKDEKNTLLSFMVKGLDGEQLVPEAEMKKLGTDAINNFCARTNRSCVIEE